MDNIRIVGFAVPGLGPERSVYEASSLASHWHCGHAKWDVIFRAKHGACICRFRHACESGNAVFWFVLRVKAYLYAADEAAARSADFLRRGVCLNLSSIYFGYSSLFNSTQLHAIFRFAFPIAKAFDNYVSYVHSYFNVK